jgi:hypothetical protein
VHAGDGRCVIASGKLEDGVTLNEDIEVYADGKLELVASRKFRMYPHMWLLPDGKILFSDAGRKTAILNPANWSWQDLPLMGHRRTASAGVLLPGGPNGSTKVLVTGGHRNNTQPPTATTESFDAGVAGAKWILETPLLEGRSHMNLPILPDGKMLGVGGTNLNGPQKTSLLYDPAANTWTSMAAQVEERGYHSTALLLPNGQVLSAGDNKPPGGGSKLELYSPPYMFRGPRPTIDHAPTAVTWNQTFAVDTSNTIARAVLIRPSAVTHTNDMNQRHIELSFTTRFGGLNVTAPPSANVAPAGHYMLFLLNAADVPSEARWLKIS